MWTTSEEDVTCMKLKEHFPIIFEKVSCKASNILILEATAMLFIISKIHFSP